MLYNLLQATRQWLVDSGLYRFLQVLDQLEFRAFAAAVMSFAIVLIFGKRTIRWLIRQKIGDQPQFYHADVNQLMASKAATPTMGGLLICAAVLGTILLLADLGNDYVRIAIAVLVVLASVGGVDDWLKLTSGRRNPGSREGLFAWEKLLFQIGIGAIAGFFAYRQGIDTSGQMREAAHVVALPFQRTYQPGGTLLEPNVVIVGMGAYVLIATLLIAGTSNAVNLTDGMDGLAGGTMMIASLAMMALSYIAGTDTLAKELMFPRVIGSQEMMVVAGAMAGACLGFLWFNCAPAMVFMGDTGSLPLGGLLAYVAVVIRQEVLLIVVGGVFFMEMFSVVLQVGYFKWTRGKRIFRCAPIHHHFHLGGWSEQQVVTRFWVLAMFLAMLALVSLKLR